MLRNAPYASFTDDADIKTIASNPMMYLDPSGFAKEGCEPKIGGEKGSESGTNTEVILPGKPHRRPDIMG